MDARLDTLSIELHQVNVRVDRIAPCQVTMVGFALEDSPPSLPVASDSEDKDDDDGDASDDDDDGSASSIDEMST